MDAHYCSYCGRWIITEADHFDICPNRNRGVEVIGKIEFHEYEKGWECPKCFRIWSPSVIECSECNKKLEPCNCKGECNTIKDIKEGG